MSGGGAAEEEAESCAERVRNNCVNPPGWAVGGADCGADCGAEGGAAGAGGGADFGEAS